MKALELLKEATEYVITNKTFRDDFKDDHPMYPFVHKLSGQNTGQVGEYIVQKLLNAGNRTGSGNDATTEVYGKLEIKTSTANWVNQIKPENDFDTLVLVYIEPDRLTVLALSKEDLLKSNKLFNNNHKSLKLTSDETSQIKGVLTLFNSTY